VGVGTHNAFQANEDNGYHQQVSEHDSKKAACENGIKIASTAGGFIPGVGKAGGPAIGILGSSLENDWLGPSPTAPAENPIQPMSIGRADREILDAMLATGHPVQRAARGFHRLRQRPSTRPDRYAEYLQAQGITIGQSTGPLAPPCHTYSRRGRPTSKCHPTNT
jgi:hypothetical protein